MKFKSKALLALTLVAACGGEIEKEEPIEIWTPWELETNNGDPDPINPDPVDPIDPMQPIDPVDPVDPVDPIDPQPSACEDAQYLPAFTPVVLDWSQEEFFVNDTCVGERESQYFTTTIPANHRLITSFVSSVKRSCDNENGGCDYFDTTNFTDEDQNVILEAVDFGQPSTTVEAQVFRIARNAFCETPDAIYPDNRPYADGRSGGPAYNPCGVIEGESQPAHFFVVEVPLGYGPIEVFAIPSNPDNWSISLQAVPAFDGNCPNEPAQCIVADDAYFRGGPNASIVLDGSFGGGRDPARALIIANASPGYIGAGFDPTFELGMRAADPSQ